MKPKARQKDIVVQILQKEILVYDLKFNKAFCLNETASAVWQKCDGQKSIVEIVEELRKEFGGSIDNEFVSLVLDQLEENSLLEAAQGVARFLNGVSRREVIRKVGLASLVTLPMVSSLIAPAAANAMSVSCITTPIPNNCPCTSNGSCDSGCCADAGCMNPRTLAVGSACRANCNCANNCCGSGRVCVVLASVLD